MLSPRSLSRLRSVSTSGSGALVIFVVLSATVAAACVSGDDAVGVRTQRVTQPCGALSYVGCCEGDTLRYCSPGGDGGAQIREIPCPQGCGFDSAFGIYICGGPLAQDPSGAPRQCPGADLGISDSGTSGDHGSIADAGPLPPDVSLGDTSLVDSSWVDGTVVDGTVVDGPVVDGHGPVVDGPVVDGPVVDGPVVDGPVVDGPVVDGPAPDAASCGSVSYKGCCAGAVLRFCVAGVVLTSDCSGAPSCGWDAQRGYYSCGTSGGAEPTDTHPKNCTAENVDGGGSADAAPGDGPSLTVEAGIELDGAPLDLALDMAVDVGGGEGTVVADLGVDAAPGLEVRVFDAQALDSRQVEIGGGGCSCAVGAGVFSPWGSLALLFALLVARRRRR